MFHLIFWDVRPGRHGFLGARLIMEVARRATGRHWHVQLGKSPLNSNNITGPYWPLATLGHELCASMEWDARQTAFQIVWAMEYVSMLKMNSVSHSSVHVEWKNILRAWEFVMIESSRPHSRNWIEKDRVKHPLPHVEPCFACSLRCLLLGCGTASSEMFWCI